jgi:hypothetical protein
MAAAVENRHERYKCSKKKQKTKILELDLNPNKFNLTAREVLEYVEHKRSHDWQ